MDPYRPRRQAAEKGPAARRRPKAAREAYSLYVERAAEGANEADGPLSATAAGGREGPSCEAAPEGCTRGVLSVRRACSRARQRSRWTLTGHGGKRPRRAQLRGGAPKPHARRTLS